MEKLFEKILSEAEKILSGDVWTRAGWAVLDLLTVRVERERVALEKEKPRDPEPQKPLPNQLTEVGLRNLRAMLKGIVEKQITRALRTPILPPQKSGTRKTVGEVYLKKHGWVKERDKTGTLVDRWSHPEKKLGKRRMLYSEAQALYEQRASDDVGRMTSTPKSKKAEPEKIRRNSKKKKKNS